MADVIISITIPSAFVTRAIAGFTESYGYQEEIPDGDMVMQPNPESKGDFTKRMLKEYVINVVKSYEAKLAAETARTESIDNQDFEIN